MTYLLPLSDGFYFLLPIIVLDKDVFFILFAFENKQYWHKKQRKTVRN
ncbi:hypothetical protein CUZ96_2068 [Enterococcus lactis]|nr:hypothetical protein [Enterococcus lactis]